MAANQPGQTPGGEEANSGSPFEDGGVLSQEELDALFNGGAGFDEPLSKGGEAAGASGRGGAGGQTDDFGDILQEPGGAGESSASEDPHTVKASASEEPHTVKASVSEDPHTEETSAADSTDPKAEDAYGAEEDLLDRLLDDIHHVEEKGEAPPWARPPHGDDSNAEPVETPGPPDITADEQAAAPAPGKERGRFRPRLQLNLPRISIPALPALGAKGAAATAAGVFAGVLTLLALYAQPYQQPTRDVLAGERSTDIVRAMSFAQNLMDYGRPVDADAELSYAIAHTPESPLRVDAEFLRLEAAFQTLSPASPAREREALHADIERVIRQARTHPRAGEALYWRARLYEWENAGEAAKTFYQEALTSPALPDNLDEVLFHAGRHSLEMGSPAEASDLLRRLLDQFPGSPRAGEGRFLLAEAYMEAGQHTEARELLEAIVMGHGDGRLGAEAAERLARMAMAAGAHGEAVEILNQRLETAMTVDGNDGVYLLLGQVLREAGDLAEAEQVLRELINFFPETGVTPLALAELALVLEGQGQRNEALRLAREVLSRHAEHGEAMMTAAAVLAEAGETAAASQAYGAALAAGAWGAEAWLAAGDAHLAAGRTTEALEAYEWTAGEFAGTPEARRAAVEAARIHYGQGRVRQALDGLEARLAGLEDPARRLPVAMALGEMYHDLGLRERAATLFTEAAASASANDDLAAAAMALIAAGDYGQGLSAAGRVDLDALENEDAYRLLMAKGRARLRADPAEGIALMEQAFEAYPGSRDAEGELELLKACLAAGRAAQARAIVTSIQAAAVGNPAAAGPLQKGAVLYGDYLFERGDYRAAAEAYGLADIAHLADTEDGQWAAYQRAAALLRAGAYGQGAEALEVVAESGSPWAGHAAVKAEYARTEQRLRGEIAAADLE